MSDGLKGKLGDKFLPPLKYVGDGFIVRKISAKDAEKDYLAVMANIQLLKNTPTPPRCGDWPPVDLSIEKDLVDLERHEEEFNGGFGYTYIVLDLEEKECLGCIYIYPTGIENYDAEVYFWVTAIAIKLEIERKIILLLAEWLKHIKVIYPGRNIISK